MLLGCIAIGIIAWFLVQLTINLTRGNLGAKFSSPKDSGNYDAPYLPLHSPNLSLTALETMRLLVQILI